MLPHRRQRCSRAPQSRPPALWRRLVCYGLGALLPMGQVTPGFAQIVANRNAPGNQQATILQTANGLPQVNIQTPNGAGVSMNSYSQFDVQRNGAILNNSPSNVQTQLGGWVTGNPWLANGGAKVIVNQVVSTNPSQLNGYVEVAGQRADVVIANPAGISVGGGGFINAAGVTLTTGIPQTSGSGTLTGFNVQNGLISINAGGLNTSSSDYTAIISRAVQVNDSLWANQLSVTTGANQVAYGLNGAATAQAGTGAIPTVAIDVAQLGGMYANKIFLVGTENGVGVSNAGTLGSTGDLTLSANGILSNTGQIQAGGNLNANLAGQVTNRGTITSTGDTTVVSGSDISNTGSTLRAGGNASLTAQGALDNTQGTMTASTGNLTVTTAGQTINDGGLLAANGQVVLTNTGLSNRVSSGTGGMIGGSRLDINSYGHAVDNTGGTLTSSGTLAIASGDLTNQGGAIGANGALNIQSGVVDNSQNGQIVGESTLGITATRLNNAGGQIQSRGDATLNTGNGTVDNTSGLLRSAGSLTINSGALINDQTSGQDQGLQANDVRLNPASLSNQQGQILANHDGMISTGGAIDNTQGIISAVNNLTLQDLAVTKTLAITNTAGQLVSGNSLTVNAASLTGDGQVLSQQDISVSLTTGLNQSGKIIANRNVTVNTSGSVSNSGQIEAGNTLTLSAGNNLSNEATGTIAATNNQIAVANTLSNTGLIDGSNTVISAQTLNNVGTGRIYGDQLAIAATTLTNDSQNGTAGTIAGRNRLDLGVGTLNNNNGALIYSGGDLAIGGALGTNHQATGSAGTVTNSSSQIAATGNLTVNAGTLNNLNATFQAEVVPGTQTGLTKWATNQGWVVSRDVGWSVGNTFVLKASAYGDTKYQPYYGATSFSDTSSQTNSVYDPNSDSYSTVTTYTPGSVGYSKTSGVWSIFGVTAPTYDLGGAPDPGSYAQGISDPAYQSAYNSWKTQAQPWITLQSAISTMTNTVNGGPTRGDHDQYVNYTETQPAAHIISSNPGSMTSGGSMTLNVSQALTNDKSQIIAGNALNVTGQTINNIAATLAAAITESGTSYHWGQTGSHKCGLFSACPDYGWIGEGYSASTPVTLTVPVYQVAANTTPSGSGYTVNSLSVSGAGNAPGSARQPGVTLPNLNLPTASLYRITPGSGSYLVTTDPQFTNYQQWLGSNYMLTAMSYDPATVQQRLGDAFYEQQLVSQQVAQLTGRAFLGSYTSTNQEYQALMNNGVTVAKALNLTLGVALTAAQVASLTSDIVWLVSEPVTLPDGTVKNVLVPQVYVVPRAGDLDGSGTLLAGASTTLNLTGDLTNSGTVAGRDVLQINAQNVNNLAGRLTGSQVTVTAQKDINNIGGSMDAQQQLSVNAGNDLNVVSTTRTGQGHDTGVASYSTTQMDRVAGLYVTGDNAQLNASAGNNLNLTAAQVQNQGNNGTTSLSAGNDINLGTVSTGASSQADWNHGNSLTIAQSKDVGSQVSGGSMSLQAGNDINARAANVAATSASGSLAVQAQGNINVVAGQETVHYDSSNATSSGGGFFGGSETTTRTTRDQTTAIASTLTGNTVSTVSGTNTNITGSNVTGQTGVTLTAGNNLNITAAANSLDQSQSSKTTSAIGFMGSNSQSQDTKSQTMAASSQINGGDIVLQSVGDTTLQAARITGNSLTVNAGSINGQTVNANAQLNINAAIESNSETHQSQNSDLMTQSMAGSGNINQSLNYTTIALKDNKSPTLNATGGVTVGATNLPANAANGSGSGGGSPATVTVDLKQQAQQLSNQPGLAYLGDLAQRHDVAFQQVQLASQSWNYSQSGLSPAGAAIIAVAVAAVSAGTAAELSAALVTSAGLTGSSASVASAALAAGMTSLASQAAVTLANNQGDLGKTLQTLGSESSVKNLAAAMVTAGALEGLGSVLGVNQATTYTGQSGSGSLTNSTSGVATAQAVNDLAGNVLKNVANNLTGTVINSAITGQPLSDKSLAGALTSALITAGVAQAANSIGDAIANGTLNAYTQAVAHAIAGCAGGAAAAGNGSGCGAGAIGGVVGELTAQFASSNGMSDTNALALAKVMSATAGLLVSNGDAAAVNVAASMGTNAAQYNALAHGQAATLASKLKTACAGDSQCMNNAVYNAIILSNSQSDSIDPASAQRGVAVLTQLAGDPSIVLSDANRNAIAMLANKNVQDYAAGTNLQANDATISNASPFGSAWSYGGSSSSGLPGNVITDNRSVSAIDKSTQDLATAIALTPGAAAAVVAAPGAATVSGGVNVAAQIVKYYAFDTPFSPTEAAVSTIAGPLGNAALESQVVQSISSQAGKTAANVSIGAVTNAASDTTTKTLTGQEMSASGVTQAAAVGGVGSVISPC